MRLLGATTTSAPDPFNGAGRLGEEAARARAGELFAQHRRMVEGLCRGLLRDRPEAEDATQQAFLSAYRALLRGTEPREPAAWLAAIARNECLARIRARMREPLRADVEVEVAASDPLAEALRRADLAALWAAISELPRQQREALLLREFGGLSYGELAVALGVSDSAVESLLFRARSRVRGRLEAAFVSFGGASWLTAAQDVLARLLSAGGAGKLDPAPVAKAVTAGVAIAVVAGGTVVGTHQGGHAAKPKRATTTAPARTHVVRPAAEVAAAVPIAAAAASRSAATASTIRPRRVQAAEIRKVHRSTAVERDHETGKRTGDASGHEGDRERRKARSASHKGQDGRRARERGVAASHEQEYEPRDRAEPPPPDASDEGRERGKRSDETAAPTDSGSSRRHEDDPERAVLENVEDVVPPAVGRRRSDD